MRLRLAADFLFCLFVLEDSYQVLISFFVCYEESLAGEHNQAGGAANRIGAYIHNSYRAVLLDSDIGYILVLNIEYIRIVKGILEESKSLLILYNLQS